MDEKTLAGMGEATMPEGLNSTRKRQWRDQRRALISFLARQGETASDDETNETLTRRVSRINRGF